MRLILHIDAIIHAEAINVCGKYIYLLMVEPLLQVKNYFWFWIMGIRINGGVSYGRRKI